MNSNDLEVAVEVGRLRPLEMTLKLEIFDTIIDVANGKMSVTEIVGVLDELKLMMQGVLDLPEGYE